MNTHLIVVTELFLQFAIVVAMVKFRSPTYGSYVYPEWTNVFGWMLAVSTSLPIPGVMVYKLMKAEGTLAQVPRELLSKSTFSSQCQL